MLPFVRFRRLVGRDGGEGLDDGIQFLNKHVHQVLSRLVVPEYERRLCYCCILVRGNGTRLERGTAPLSASYRSRRDWGSSKALHIAVSKCGVNICKNNRRMPAPCSPSMQ